MALLELPHSPAFDPTKQPAKVTLVLVLAAASTLLGCELTVDVQRPGTHHGGSSSGGTTSGGTSSGGTDGGTTSGGTSTGGGGSSGATNGGTDSGGTDSGGTSSGGTDSGGTSSGGSGGTMGGSAGSGGTTGGTSGAGGSSGSGGTPGGSACFHVAPNGNDANARASAGATPFASVQAAVDFAESHASISSSVCVAAGATCGASFTYDAGRGDLTMRDGVSVFGGYESTTFSRCTNSETVLAPRQGAGVSFGPEIANGTVLDGLVLRATVSSHWAVVSVRGALGVELRNLAIESTGGYNVTGVTINEAAEVSLVESDVTVNARGQSVAVLAENARLSMRDDTVDSRAPIFAYGVWLQNSPGSAVLDSELTAVGPPPYSYVYVVHVEGASTGVDIRNNVIRGDGGDGQAVGVGLHDCSDTAVNVVDNAISVEGGRGPDRTGPAQGVYSYNHCPANVSDNLVHAAAGYDSEAAGVFCDGRCEIADNEVSVSAFASEPGSVNRGTGIDCRGCATIRGNLVKGLTSVVPCNGACDHDSVGIDLVGDTTLVERNHIDGGCSGGPTGGEGSVGIRARGTARIQNNVVFGGKECPTPVGAALTRGVLITGGDVDLHSNWIDGGQVSTGVCTSAGVWLSGANTSKIRNNIIRAGNCRTGSNLLVSHPHFGPLLVANNDLEPGVSGSLYRDFTKGHLQRIEDVNAIPDFSVRGSFSASCPIPLVSGSACVDAGSSEGTPERDFDGEARDTHPDVGPDELDRGASLRSCSFFGGVEGASPCRSGAACTDLSNGDYRCACPPGLNGKNCDIPFAELSSGLGITCGRRTDGKTVCWGGDAEPLAAVQPTVPFKSIEMAPRDLCGLDANDRVRCFGQLSNDVDQAPDLPFYAVSAGASGACGIDRAFKLQCWGSANHMGPVPTGWFSSLSMGTTHGCAIQTSPPGVVQCWGFASLDFGQMNPPAAAYQQVRSGTQATCGIRNDYSIDCWGSVYGAPVTPPPGAFVALDYTDYNGCALSIYGTLSCWGTAITGTLVPPSGNFRAISAGYYHACAIGGDDRVRCFGFIDDEVPTGQP